MHRKKTKPLKAKYGKQHIQDLEQKRRGQLFEPHYRTSSKNSDRREKAGALRCTQMTGLFFLLLLSNAYVIEAHSKVSQAPASSGPSPKKLTEKEKQNLKTRTYKDVCTDSTFTTYNKPNVTLGAHNGRLVLKSCMDGNTALCTQERQLYDLYNTNSLYNANLITLMRGKVKVDFNNWAKTVSTEISEISSVTQQQADDFNEIFSMVKIFKLIEVRTKYINDAHGGQCIEHASLAMSKLFHVKLAYDLPMHIALLIMSSSTSQEAITDHVCILLDSDASNLEIVNNAKAVNKALSKITKGKICDGWNHGYYVDFVTDTSGLYKKEAKWDNLKIVTYSLNFKKFNTLPHGAQQYICKKLQQMGFDVEPKGSCSSKVFTTLKKKKKKKKTSAPKKEL